MNNRVYDSLKRIFARLVIRLFRAEITGLENIPESGNFMICGNHLSMGDIFLQFCFMPGYVRFMAKQELFKIPVIGYFMKKLGAVPVKRGYGDVAAVRKMISLCKEGETISIYPQGHRYKGEEPKREQCKDGAALICTRAGCDILPVAFYGKGWRIKPFHKTKIIVGKPIKYEELGITEENARDYGRITDIIFSEILKLLAECN